MKIRDSVTVITGASRGIGLAIAERLGAEGAALVLAARSTAALSEAAERIPGASAVTTDITKAAGIQKLIEAAMKRHGRIDLWVNNAGQGLRAPVDEVRMVDYRAIMELNVFAVLEAMQAVIPIMKRQHRGMILNIGSMVSKNYYPGLAAYASTKYALNALTLTAREELKGEGIVVSVFHPRMTATDFGANALGTTYSSAAGRPGMPVDSPEAVAAQVAEQIASEAPEAHM
jgi:short-subunit dehydrogenase